MTTFMISECCSSYSRNASCVGYSEDSISLRNTLISTFNHLDQIISSLRIFMALQSIDNLYKAYSSENWDGFQAKPISIKALEEAKKLISLLPSTFPLPEVMPEPGGEIAFEWYKNKQYIFIISVGGNNIITYAGIFGEANKTHGTEFFSDSLPSLIIQNIQRLNLENA
jgi:hypothetical protein